MARAWGDADAPVLAGEFGALLTRAAVDGLANEEGQVDEYVAFGGSWGFDPADVAVPVRIWQGDTDRWVPMEWANRLATLVKDGSVRQCPGDGHLLFVHHWPEILTWLSATG